MSPELRKQMEEQAEQSTKRNISDAESILQHERWALAFLSGAEWMHRVEVVPRDELIMQMKDCLEQCEDQGFVMPGEYDKVIELIKEWKGGEG